MNKSSAFSEVVDAADLLTLEEKEELLEILRRRTVEQRREQLKNGIRAARKEYAAGKLQPATPGQIMRDIQK